MTIAKKRIIIGISPRNPHYTKANIGFTLDTLLQGSENVLVFIPDALDVHNYLAYGYEEEKASKKATSVGHALRKSVYEVCANRHYSVADSAHTEAQVGIIDWSADVSNYALYKESLDEIERLYQTNSAFTHDVRDASEHSIQSRINFDPSLQDYFDKTGIEKGIDRAVHYILSELAFLNIAPRLFGAEHVEYVYHREWPVYENLITGQYDGCSRPQLGLKIICNSLSAK